MNTMATLYGIRFVKARNTPYFESRSRISEDLGTYKAIMYICNTMLTFIEITF